MSPLRVKPPSVVLVLAALLAALGVARGGHELPVYPSYYPHEIAIETMPSEHAADLLRDAKLQAYLGAEPRFPGALPASIRAVESLGSFAAAAPIRHRFSAAAWSSPAHGHVAPLQFFGWVTVLRQ